MALPGFRGQREYDKFVDDGSGNTAVRAVLSSGTISGDLTITGDLSVEGDFIFSSASVQSLFLGDDDSVKYGNTAGSPDFSMGVNSGDSDNLTLSRGGTLGTTNVLTIDKTKGQIVHTSSAAGTETGHSVQVTGSGAGASLVSASKFSLLAGYTGSGSTFGVYAQNQTAGTATNEFGSAQAANYGEYIATTAGTIIGQAGYASGGDKSYGGFQRAIVDKAGAVNIGTAGFAQNTVGTAVGIFAGLMDSAPTYESAAFIADNGVAPTPIILGRDNGTTVFEIGDGGATMFKSTDATPIELQISQTSPGNFPRTNFFGGQDNTDTNWLVRFAHKDTSATEIPAGLQITTNNVSNYSGAQGLGVIQNTTESLFYTFTGSSGAGLPLVMGTHGTTGAAAAQAFRIGREVDGQLFKYLIDTNSTNHTASTEFVAYDIDSSATRTWATGALTKQRDVLVQAPTLAFAGASTVTEAATFAITGAPIAGTNATLTDSYALWVESGSTKFEGRVLGKAGNLASANDLTFGEYNSAFITGTTQINAITTAGWSPGSTIVLGFQGALTVKHNTSGGGGTAVIMLSGAADFEATANDTLVLHYNGVSWSELSRTTI